MKKRKAQSCPQKGRKHALKSKIKDQAQLIRKLSKLSVPEIKKKISFLMLLIRNSSSKGLNKIHCQFLEKLKDMLSVLELKKNTKEYIT